MAERREETLVSLWGSKTETCDGERLHTFMGQTADRVKDLKLLLALILMMTLFLIESKTRSMYNTDTKKKHSH